MLKYMRVLLFLTVINTGLCLKCYDCKTDKADGCLRKSNPKSMTCPASGPNEKATCFYKELNDPAKKAVKIVASCGVELNMKDCESEGMVVKQCTRCYADLCNSSAKLSTRFFVFLCFFVAYYILTIISVH